jgi:CheY-like chemotaxis protein
MNVAPRLLLVEENLALARALKRRAQSSGWVITHVATYKDAKNIIQLTGFDAWIVSDILEGQDGMRLVREHESTEQSCRRPLRPKTALWSAEYTLSADELELYEVRTFFKTDVVSMLDWLALNVEPIRSRYAEVIPMFRKRSSG